LTVCELPEFRRAAERFMSEDEIDALCDFLARNPMAGALVPGTGGVRKVRWALAGQGKRGGMRAIYFYHDARFPLLLVTAYAKSAKDNLTAAERNVMAALVDAIKAGRKRQ
jgi:hypothetical protein